ncbi:helix-turn-helix transcriptional regulator [uncultured Oscillibacter sp.]|uniref:helix-turn-helix domain-containing protein n=1 Tax=uncultured Oscillibacter sp. TaxID=876091 RepID=UPI00341C2DDE
MFGVRDILAKRLRKCRDEAGLTQIKVAIYCDITEKAYQNYELGVHEPKLSILARIARLYKVSIDYLVGLTDDPKPYPRSPE